MGLVVLIALRRLWSLLLCLLAVGMTPLPAPAALKDVTVLVDDHHPPYVFRDAKGDLTGQNIDYWRLWEQKTGARAHIIAMDWRQAQTAFQARQADVIDLIQETPERAKAWRFSDVYAEQSVVVYTDQDISGINSLDTLRGFFVGVRGGDRCEDVLRDEGVLVDPRYGDYEEMISEAAAGRLRIFCMPEAPATHWMVRAGIDHRFHPSVPLFQGQYRRAYLRDDPATMADVEAGFLAISASEMSAIRDRWQPRVSPWRAWPRYVGYAAVAVTTLLFAMLIWSGILRRMVRQRTSALNNERRFLRTLINTLPDMVWLKDKDGAYRLCNAKVEAYFGAPESNIIGKKDEEFVPHELAHRFREEDQQALEAGGPIAHQNRLNYLADGHVVEVETIKTPMRDAKGQLIGVLGIARDVTQLRQNELRMQRLNQLYRVLMDVSEVVTKPLSLLAMYRAICDIVVRESGVQAVVVWEPNAASDQLLSVCAAGRGLELDQAWTLPLSEPDDRLSVSSQEVFRTGRPHYLEIQAEHASVLPGLQAGVDFRSIALLPLMVGAQVRAVCHLFTDNPAFFDDAVKELMLRLTDTIGMALQGREAQQAQRAAQEKLAQSEARFSKMFVTSPVGMLLSRLDDQIVVDVNEAWQRLVGLRREGIVSQTTEGLPIWPAEVLQQRQEALRQLKWGEDVERVDTQILNQQGELRDVVWSATRIQLADDMYQLESFVDITLQKQANKHLAYHNERLESAVSLRTAELHSLFQALPDHYYRLSLDGTILDHRSGLQGRVTLYDLKKGMKLQQGLPADAAERLTQLLGQLSPQHQSVLEYELSQDGVQSAPVFEARLLPLGEHEAIAVVRDVTQQRQLDRDREAARMEAERLARVKSEFLANMSHEIRTPLNGVLGLAQVGYIESQGAPIQKTFETILDSGKVLLGVLNDVLDISKLEAGQLSIEQQPLALRALLEEALTMVRSRAQAKQLQLTLQVDARVPETIQGDALRIEQVVLNLLSNAIKFTEAGSIRLAAHVQEESLCLSVEDTGIGMDAASLQAIFEPFKQADSSTTRRYGGTGLGLSICKRLVELMGGRIEASSQLGRGSRFQVSLPWRGTDDLATTRTRPDRMTAVTGLDHRLPDLQGVRILAAEDSEVNQIVLRELLVMEGAHFEMVDNGLMAVERVQETGPEGWDVVLMDVQMPVMDGYEAARRIHALDDTLPIIGLTAHAFADALESCRAAGMVAHVSKPYDLRKLVSTICAHQRRKST